MPRTAPFAATAALAATLAMTAGSVAAAGLEDGTWVGWAVTPVMAGDTVPVIEELTISGDTIRQQGWSNAFLEPACHEFQLPVPAPRCRRDADLGTGRIELDGTRLRVVPEGAPVNPHVHPVDAALWPSIALIGSTWEVVSPFLPLALERRDAPPAGTPVERIYFPAPPGSGGALFLHLVAHDLSLGRAYCGLAGLSIDIVELSALFRSVALYRPVIEEIDRLSTIRRPPFQVMQRRMALSGINLPGEAPADVSDIDAAAREAWLAQLAWMRAGMPVPEGQELLTTLAFVASPEAAEAEARCLARHRLD